jgi:hypothetical protein
MSRFSREEDIRMLREVLETERLDSGTRESFNDMLHSLTSGERWCLSTDQRDWLKRYAEPSYENLVSRKKVSATVRHRHKELAPCTPACPAWRPPTLVHLPKRPPGGRA